jgi:nitroimidazol reductase NimA-like FMN-containing flavoprotein (pyridoxamine 5'-phosphate oxidase superfamily)
LPQKTRNAVTGAGRHARTTGPPSGRARVRRLRKRGHYDRKTINGILDGGILCHVGFLAGESPVVIPTLYWREGDWLYLHGSVASRMLADALRAPVCVTVTQLDGLVLTRSAFHHSVNYRSVVMFGRPEEVADPREREARMRVFMQGLFPGRWDTLRPVKPKEIRATRLLRLRIDEASAKIRSGPPAEDAADYDWPAWGGIIPLAVRAGRPRPDAHVRNPRLRAPTLAKFRPPARRNRATTGVVQPPR